MGIYDRDYFRQERPGFSLGLPHSAVVTLILLNAAVWVADGLLGGDGPSWHAASDSICWPPASAPLTHPWLWWQFVTYGFVHDPDHFSHILFNMLVLWFLGRDVEELYGRAEFVRLYLVLVVVGGVAWAAVNLFLARPRGAGGGLRSAWPEGDRRLGGGDRDRDPLRPEFSAPHAPLHVRAAHAGLGLGRDGRALRHLRGHAGGPSSNVAFSVHLAGAAFAVLYFQQRWNFGALLQGRFAWPWFRSRGRLRIHRHEPDDGPSERELREKEVDRILEKIHREGEGSLTRKERRILETASREYQQRLPRRVSGDRVRVAVRHNVWFPARAIFPSR